MTCDVAPAELDVEREPFLRSGCGASLEMPATDFSVLPTLPPVDPGSEKAGDGSMGVMRMIDSAAPKRCLQRNGIFRPNSASAICEGSLAL